MGHNPASVDIRNGIVYINREMWQKLNDHERAIILLHEEGHFKGKTLDEVKADIYTIDKYLQDADTPQRRRELLTTIFKIVPDEQRKLIFVKNLFQYDAVNTKNRSSERAVQAINEYTANFASETLFILDGATKLLNVGLQFWATVKDKKSYWRSYLAQKKENIINSAADAAITNRFLKSGGDIGATFAAATRGRGDTKGLWYDTFLIVAAGTKFDNDEFNIKTVKGPDGKTYPERRITASEGSAIWWNKQGYGEKWMYDRVKHNQKQLQETWDSMSFFSKVQNSTRYKLYLLAFAVACFVVWKM